MDSKQTSLKPTNFIRNTIDEDLLKGKHRAIITRFPPEPNGYLHIGHAKSICLNFGTALDYGGYHQILNCNSHHNPKLFQN
jgi:glutaminyl-tRNA synthetase